MSLLDVIVFHELLRWHHLYDQSTPAVARTSDGIIDALGTVALVVGLVALVERNGPRGNWGLRTWGGILAGAGGFNLFDGIVDHKLLGLHQVREGADNQLPYDVAWIGSALLVLIIGLMLIRGADRTTGPNP
jgi:uncharacterized membrane protein